jgi:D-alanyl-D-alanine carboxypeptidase/D-alanyl-D-alanine-endopeptidase (penicillin-binding protein 4)
MLRLKNPVFVLALVAALAVGASAQGREEEDYAPAPLKPSPTPVAAPARPRLVVPTLMTMPSVPATKDAAAEPDDFRVLSTSTYSPTPAPTPYQHQGVYVTTLDGRVVMEQAAGEAFNPASAVKLATALKALRDFGPEYRFSTVVWTNGTFDKATGTLTGDLMVSGRDPSLHSEHAVDIARELNRLGIRTVTGDLYVSPGFTMNFSPTARRSGDGFYDTLDSTRRSAAATRAWTSALLARKDQAGLASSPSVAVMGAVYVAPVPAGARVLLTHRSSALTDLLKVLLCYSNNFMADRLGESVGGPAGLREFLIKEFAVPEWEVRLASASGLGVNRLSPRSMMKVYAGLRKELAKHGLEPSDILPVAGIDPGTLQKRYAASVARGSIIGKTGTLGRTDGGASALVGELRTRTGETLLFVIFNRRGSVYRFRQDQDALVSSLQFARGGPAPFTYVPHTLAMRLADTEFDARTGAKGEYESISN